MKDNKPRYTSVSDRFTSSPSEHSNLRHPTWIFLAALLAIAAFHLPVLAQTGWQEEIRLTNDEAASLTPPNNGKYLTVDMDGNLHVVWADDRDRNFEIYHKIRSDGIWSSDERLTFSAERSARPVLAVDKLRRVHLVWNDSRDGNKEIYHKFWNGSWSNDRRVTETAGNSFGSSIVADGFNIHLVYHEDVSGHLEIMYRSFDFLGWSKALALTNVGSGDRMVPSIAIGPDGSLHVAWWDTREDSTCTTNGKIYYRAKSQDWLDEELITGPSADAMRPSIVVDDSCHVHIAWIDKRDIFEQIYYMRLGGKGWEPETCLTSGSSTHFHPSMAAAGNEVFLVYWDNHLSETNSEIFFRRLVGGIWSGPLRVSNGPASSTLCCLIAEPNKNLHTAWVDERDGNMEIYYKAYIDPANGIGDDENHEPPDEIKSLLRLNAKPNPFWGSTLIEFSIPDESDVSIRIYDIKGRCIKRLVERRLPYGSHPFTWNGRDDRGRIVASGVYIVLARAGKKHISSK
ncbi:MAG: hypothetical protein KAX38_00510, partial [Candidatus Krumholzibacteria bacterium]|nr:hypothetical protein [Candidatus Krumholzibacteria bacterium]